MKEGAYDFIPKPFKPTISRSWWKKRWKAQRLRREKEVLSEEVDKRYRLVAGKSAKMNAAMRLGKEGSGEQEHRFYCLAKAAPARRLFARAIHNWSERKDRPFMAINCVGLSRELLESELFGYEKGAFTGATQLKRGKIEIANGGTVFLDEVGDISEELQAKLLRFLQEREFERVGGTQLIRVDVRIIAATNRDLDEAVKDGRFRSDLYYRLNVIPISLPSLRERQEDVSALAQFFMQRFSMESKKNFTGFPRRRWKHSMFNDWPGNVRELANVIERAVVLGQPPTIQAKIYFQGSPRRRKAITARHPSRTTRASMNIVAK